MVCLSAGVWRGVVVAVPARYVVSVFLVISLLYLIFTGGLSHYHLHKEYYGTGPGFYVCSLVSQLFSPAHLSPFVKIGT